MKFSCLQENLKQGLVTVSHVAGKNVNLPILNNILISVKGGDINLTATDLEIGVVSSVRGKIEKEGNFTVDAKILTDYVGLLPNKKITVNLSGSDLNLESENFKTKIKGQTAEEYPLIPRVEKESQIKIKTEDFKKSLNQTLFSVASSDARIELSGVCFSSDNSSLIMAATDSYRLAEKTIPMEINGTTPLSGGSVIIPSKTLLELSRIINSIKSGDETAVSLYFSENQILFSLNQTELVSRLIEGQYPDYRQIIPSNQQTKAVINRLELIRAVKAASLFSKTGINDINLDFPSGRNQAVITAASGQTGEQTTELECAVTGKDNGVVINYRYFLDGLNNIDTEEVALEIVDGNTPLTVKPVNGDDYLYLIMPIKQ